MAVEEARPQTRRAMPIEQVAAEIGEHQRRLVVTALVVAGFEEMFEPPVDEASAATNFMTSRNSMRSGSLRAAGFEDPRDLRDRRDRVRDMLHHVAGHNEIEALVEEGQALQILADHPVLDVADRHILEQVRPRVARQAAKPANEGARIAASSTPRGAGIFGADEIVEAGLPAERELREDRRRLIAVAQGRVAAVAGKLHPRARRNCPSSRPRAPQKLHTPT